jgi:anthranilate synthase component 1
LILKAKPSFENFVKLSSQGNMIPIYNEFLADMETPVSAYLKIKDSSFSYLLESADGGRRWGRYSFIGYRPYIISTLYDDRVAVQNGDKREFHEGIKNPLNFLRELSAPFKAVPVEGLPPFQGGLVGFFNYDLIRKWERIPGIHPEENNLPEGIFMAARRMIIFDHLTHKIKVVVFAHLKGSEDIRKTYETALGELEQAFECLQNPIPAPSETKSLSISELESNFQKEEFEEAVRKAKDYIVAGDLIQVVLSQRFSGKISGDAFSLYRNLRSLNPSPYMFYLNFGAIRLIGASPEILVRLTDGNIELRPIAGTRPRGTTQEEDKDLEQDLMGDPKELAEHIMLVDLGRNDVGKVASPGSVTVPKLMEVERYSHVMHIVSHVEGRLRVGMDCFDLFMSAFPAGTVSGAPKIRAMEIISELEPSVRGPYAGAVGYFGFNGNMDFCITIRTITIARDQLTIQVGAGIVADSSPEGEYNETLRKAAAMLKSIEEVKGNDPSYR